MKTFKSNILPASLILLAVSFSSCNKFLDVNESPNSADKAPVGTILNAAFVSHINAMEGQNARLGCMWSQQFTGVDRQYSAYDNYIVNSEAFDFENEYYGTCEQAKKVIELATESDNKFYVGVAQILQAQSFGTLAALYGDIPFTEANDLYNFPDPKFDTQEDVYAGVQDLLDDAIANLESGVGGDIEGADFFFAGDAESWVKVAKILKARYYTHTKNYTMAATEATKALSHSTADWIAPHPGDYNFGMNIYHSFGQYDRFGYMDASQALLPQLLDTASGLYRGVDSITDETARFADLFDNSTGVYDLNYAGSLFGETSSFPLVTNLECQLILAEANSKNNDITAALNALNAARAEIGAMYPSGIYASYSSSDFQVGGIKDAGKGDEAANLYHEIIVEKYVSLVGQMEVFNDLRRTNNEIGITPKGSEGLPERYLYPQVELNANSNAPSTVPGLFDKTTVNL